MSNRALVILAPGCEEIEAVTSIDTLVRGGIKVTTASISPDKKCDIIASRGVHLVADHLLEEIAHETFEVIVLPGGLPGAEYLRDNPLVIELLKKQQANDLWRAAICATPAFVLAHHDLIGNALVTGYPSTQSQLPAKQVRQDRVVVDKANKLITSQGPATSIDFALAIVAELQGKETAAQVRKDMLA
jgi:4-methyl-5(b-hydroxyethyl)-thiazole monophosphate biosynthesis